MADELVEKPGSLLSQQASVFDPSGSKRQASNTDTFRLSLLRTLHTGNDPSGNPSDPPKARRAAHARRR